jgi:hypothetical protein
LVLLPKKTRALITPPSATRSREAFAPPSISGVAELREKIHSSLLLLHKSKPFQHYYRRTRELREGYSVKWNDGLLSDFLEALKTAAGLVIKY